MSKDILIVAFLIVFLGALLGAGQGLILAAFFLWDFQQAAIIGGGSGLLSGTFVLMLINYLLTLSKD